MLLNLLFVIISLGLVWFAPDQYSFSYCLVITLFYLFQNYILFSSKAYKNIASFEFLFFISFFICSFIYPIFYYPMNPYVSIYAVFPFNENIITYATSLAGLAYSSYLLGFTTIRKKDKANDSFSNLPYINNSAVIMIAILSIVSFLGYLLTGGLSHLQAVYQDGENLDQVGLFSYFNNIFNVATLLLVMFVLRMKSKSIRNIILVYILISIILILATGSRSIVIAILSILLVSYSKTIKVLSKPIVFSALLVGIVLMSFIVQFREEGNFSLKDYSTTITGSKLDVFMDLIITTRNLYVLVDFTESNFKSYFVTAIEPLLSPIPTLSKYIVNFNLPIDIMGGRFPTFLEFGPNSNYGLGTNMVGEMYFSFGIYGVIFISYILGMVIKFTKNKANNKYFYFIYLYFVSIAIFYPRGFYLPNMRNLIWGLIILWLIYKFLRLNDSEKYIKETSL